ncbi:MAG: nitrate- and nitrite sensing domain-containing protein, partial [Comamonas sp.]
MKTPLHYLVAARQNEIAELEQLGSACALVSRMSQLIHALQKERGLSNIFLASEGAQGREALDQHQPWVQQAIAELSATLEAFSLGLSGAHGARLFSAIAYALQGIEALPLLRAHRDGQRLTPEESTQA